MFKSSINLAVVAAALISMAAVCRAAEQDLLERAAHGPQQKSGLAAMGDSFSSGVKKGWGALAKPFESLAPKSNSADPTRIETPVDPSADLYAAVARRDEDQGRFREAEEQYRKSLKASSTHLASLLGYGRLLDRQGRHAEAMEQYHRAVKAYPRDARPLNYLSLSLASHGKFDEAVATMEQAIRLEPRQAVYRNNMAVILVEAGKNEAAFRHLCAVHDEATAYYNLGYLLQKRGDTDAALRHFAFALKRNPKFAEARVWIDNLRQVQQSQSLASRIARRPDTLSAGQPPVVEGHLPAQVAPSPGPRAAGTPPVDPRGLSPDPTHQPRYSQGPFLESQAAGQPQAPALQQPPVATDPRRISSPWPPSPGVATTPDVQRFPATGTHGSPRANVVYPLPPVESSESYRR